MDEYCNGSTSEASYQDRFSRTACIPDTRRRLDLLHKTNKNNKTPTTKNMAPTALPYKNIGNKKEGSVGAIHTWWPGTWLK